MLPGTVQLGPEGVVYIDEIQNSIAVADVQHELEVNLNVRLIHSLFSLYLHILNLIKVMKSLKSFSNTGCGQELKYLEVVRTWPRRPVLLMVSPKALTICRSTLLPAMFWWNVSEDRSTSPSS